MIHLYLAHAGEDHATEPVAGSDNALAIGLITIGIIAVLALALRWLSANKNDDNKETTLN